MIGIRIALAADHAGFQLKEKIKGHLESAGYAVMDCGTANQEPVDYPDFAKRVADAVASGKCERGILLCGTGIGMSIAANKRAGVYAALCHDERSAALSRAHNNSNVLTLGGRTTPPETAMRIVDAWLSTEFEGGRHKRRTRKIQATEQRTLRVAVSLLTANESEMTVERMREKLPALEAAGADTIQWDIMDGVYNPNSTLAWFTAEAMKAVMERTTLDSEAHLMVAEPWAFADSVKDCCSTIIFHVEACSGRDEVLRTVQKIRALGKRVGIALEPETPLERIEEYLDFVDMALVMTVKTGYAGQKFIDMSGKIRALAEIRKARKLDFEIEADGGISDKTVGIVRAAGCDAVNSASYILSNDFKTAIGKLKGIA